MHRTQAGWTEGAQCGTRSTATTACLLECQRRSGTETCTVVETMMSLGTTFAVSGDVYYAHKLEVHERIDDVLYADPQARCHGWRQRSLRARLHLLLWHGVRVLRRQPHARVAKVCCKAVGHHSSSGSRVGGGHGKGNSKCISGCALCTPIFQQHCRRNQKLVTVPLLVQTSLPGWCTTATVQLITNGSGGGSGGFGSPAAAGTMQIIFPAGRGSGCA